MAKDQFQVTPELHDALVDLYTITLRNIMYDNDFSAHQQFLEQQRISAEQQFKSEQGFREKNRFKVD
jgi:hypothetical protein